MVPFSGYPRFQRFLQKLRQLLEHKSDNDNNGRFDNNGGHVVADNAGPRSIAISDDHHGKPEQHHFDSRRFQTKLFIALSESWSNLWRSSSTTSLLHSTLSLNRLHEVRYIYGKIRNRKWRFRMSVLSVGKWSVDAGLHAAIHRWRGRLKQLRARRLWQTKTSSTPGTFFQQTSFFITVDAKSFSWKKGNTHK